jgi:nitroimidazol reductase NimA-like FMN-containing flavoprotein (pyridoxamine 5'-phosphate oxidase superfamily)
MSEATIDAANRPPVDGRPMTADEQAAFLARPWVCHLACLDDDGHPYVVPLWFEHADGGFYFVARGRAAWARYLQRDARASLSIVSTENRSHRVLVKGVAEVVEEANIGGRWFEVNRRLSHRYMPTQEIAARYVERTQDEPRWLIFVRPLHATTWMGGWSAKYKHSDWTL